MIKMCNKTNNGSLNNVFFWPLASEPRTTCWHRSYLQGVMSSQTHTSCWHESPRRPRMTLTYWCDLWWGLRLEWVGRQSNVLPLWAHTHTNIETHTQTDRHVVLEWWRGGGVGHIWSYSRRRSWWLLIPGGTVKLYIKKRRLLLVWHCWNRWYSDLKVK